MTDNRPSDAMVRTTARIRIKNITGYIVEKLRMDEDDAHSLAISISQGNAQRAREFLLLSAKDAKKYGAPARELRTAYLYLESLIDGANRANMSEVRLLGEVVGADEGLLKLSWKEYISYGKFLELFNLDEGKETNLVAGKGKGKTHLMGLIAEAWVKQGMGIVATNINGLVIFGHEDKCHRVYYESELLKLRLDNPDVAILFLADELGVALQTKRGSTQSIDEWNLARPMLRKLDITTLYAWQLQRQIFPQLREDPLIGTITKNTRTTADLDYEHADDHDTFQRRFRVNAIPDKERRFDYRTKGMTSFFPDIHFPKFVKKVMKANSQEAEYAILRDEFYNKENYVLDEISKDTHPYLDWSEDDLAKDMQDTLETVRGAPEHCKGPQGRWDRDMIRAHVGGTTAQARVIAAKLNKEEGAA